MKTLYALSVVMVACSTTTPPVHTTPPHSCRVNYQNCLESDMGNHTWREWWALCRHDLDVCTGEDKNVR